MIIALAGQKGGSGKSTTAIALAAEAHARGRSVLLVDADPQATARTWGAVATEAGHPAPTVIAMGAGMHRPEQLPRVAAGFELVVIDCPPRAGDIQRSALAVADLALLPCGPGGSDAWALASTIETVTEAQTLRPALKAAVVLTRKQGRTALGAGAREALAASGLPVLRAELGHRIAYVEAITAGRGVTAYAPRSEAAGEVRALLDEVLSLLAPAPPTPKAPHGKQRKPRQR